MTGRVLPYDVQGDGPRRALVLHNWFGDRTSFAPLRTHLNDATGSYAFVDCRGYGEALDHPGEYTMEEVAADALAVADDLGWDSFSVIGHSMGGKAAQLVLLDAPDRVRSIIGISPVSAAGFPSTERPGSSSPAPPRSPPTGARSSTTPPAAGMTTPG